MPPRTNPDHGSPGRSRTPLNVFRTAPWIEQFDSSPDTPPHQVPEPTPADDNNEAAQFLLEATEADIPDTPTSARQRRNAIHALLPERPFQDVDSHAFNNPWPNEQSQNPGQPDVSHRCSHDLVYPCFCRNKVEQRGSVCRNCRATRCSVNRLLRMGTVDMLELELQREIARQRGANQFLSELQRAVADAQRHEETRRMLETNASGN
ncbi:uncharacterized protein CTRU02_208345 [Colletotrichum truncatum]|uniref:Uncharacterized protein n=1 Tax=Colletotrichum truncatum TaxID=5467 RepID=A0ACC3YW05_COLTU|nr:uncharacterized protein CTRU02_07471 [Colletotrichum truncatum]KAF6791131.1 hypothetical protein CTRU02_07471 [Colletotrichum truncatum]